MKIIGKILLISGGLLILLLVLSTIYHMYQIRSEAKEYPPPGNLVEINNNEIHVYTQGQGDNTLVFLAGSGTSCPTIDFKPLWDKLTDEYKIVVVEKSGYGWSETSSSSRNIDTILTETRKALQLSGKEGPYVLVPHSMSGLEAIYWAQNYPEEVKAIIGLDMVIPDVYLDSSFELPSKSQLYFMYLISRIGLTRFMGESGLEKNIPLLKSKDLSNEDKEKLKAIFYKSSLTKNMLNEIDKVKNNARMVKRKDKPTDTPMYFFIAEDSKNNIIPNWEDKLTEYLSEIKSSRYKLLDTSHYIHHEKSKVIVQEIKNFLQDIKID